MKTQRPISVLLLAIASPLAIAQATQASPPAAAETPDYDVVSTHIDHRSPGSSGTDVRNGAYTASDGTIKDLLEQPYDIRQDLISGVPGPLDSVRFDVRAKIVDPDLAAVRKLTDAQRHAMLLPLLAERFHLKAHLASVDIYSVPEGGVCWPTSKVSAPLLPASTMT